VNSIADSIYVSEEPVDKSWIVDQQLVAELNLSLYQLKIKNDSSESLALSQLDQLFESLIAQVETPMENRFVSDIHEFCRARLKEELRFKQKLSPDQFRCWTNERIAYVANLDPLYVSLLKFLTVFKRKHLEQRARQGLQKRTDLTVDSGITIFLSSIVLEFAMRNAGVLERLKLSFSNDLKVIGAALELSVSGSTWWRSSSKEFGGINTDYAHFDEAIESPKAIVYLSHVGSESGPTEFYPGLFESLGLTPLQELVSRVIGRVDNNRRLVFCKESQYSEIPSHATDFRSLLFRLPAELRFISHFGWDVPESHKLESEFISKKNTVLGGPGTALIFDGGRVVHRGGLIRTGERAVFQVVFGHNRSRFFRSVLSRLRRK